MKKLLCSISTLTLCLFLSACAHEHTWQEATCTTPKTCTECNEIEGDVLDHVWTDATCTDAKTCNLCAETDGEPLGHDLTEANYQQPATCKVCETTEGEPLQAIYEEWGIDKYAAELDKAYDFEMPCYDDSSKTTITKVTFSNLQTFASDDAHPEKEGFEWKTVDMKVEIAEGVEVATWYDTFYKWIDNEKENCFSVNYNGTEYTDCEVYFSNGQWSDWESNNQYGWDKICTYTDTVEILVPVGYDGFVFGIYDPQSNFMEVDLKDADPSDYVYYRIK